MFDEITIKKNKDDTYALIMRGYKDTNTEGTFDIRIKRLKDFPIEIDKKSDCSYRNHHIPRSITTDYIMKVEARMLPDEKGRIIEIHKRNKVRRIRNRNF
ncbi:hypothetical protein GRF59_14790 [Paenibacillus sp. HJL G12]|uniref:Uncharacterized protein n=1 Tax=Paenibacillus dendrobii TaxID=2691084 RepID=A0A7X3LGL7_9BACL|nr:hypothetical protein [Paenibacillus dendrobii]MWV44886.1 hypothetical protein [Paenibacillus dendrobii]